MDEGDAAFIFAPLDDPAFLEFIGDRGVRNEAQAIGYIEREGKLKNGFSLWAVTLREEGTAGCAAWCGAIRCRMWTWGLRFCLRTDGKGLGREATLAVLEQVGFRFERTVVLEGQSSETCVYQLGSG